MSNISTDKYRIYVRDNSVNINFNIESAAVYLKTPTVHFKPTRLKNRTYNRIYIYIITNEISPTVTFSDSIKWESKKLDKLKANSKYLFTLTTLTNLEPNIIVARLEEVSNDGSEDLYLKSILDSYATKCYAIAMATVL